MKDVDMKLFTKLPKYARTSSNGAEIEMLYYTNTCDGNHYTVIYADGETFEEYGYKDFLYCIKNRIQT